MLTPKQLEGYKKTKATTISKYGEDHYYKLGLRGGQKRVLKDKACSTCSKEFRPKSSLSKFCSYTCAVKGRQKKGKWKICICGKRYYLKQSQVRIQNFCSKECAYRGLIKSKTKVCKICSKEYSVTPSQEKWRGISKYCSIKCRGEGQKAINQKARSERTKYPKELRKYKKWVWKYFSDYVRNRDAWTCFTCGKYEKGPTMHAGHFISRVRSATMFDEKNVHAQCYGCNIGKKGNAGEYAYRIIQTYGKEVLDDLVLRSRQTHKFTYDELEAIYQHSKKRIKELT